MKKHIKTYFDFFDYGEQDIVCCEVCKDVAVDIHHIVYRSQGGQDDIENLMALCRKCHDKAHGKDELFSTIFLQQLHLNHLHNAKARKSMQEDW